MSDKTSFKVEYDEDGEFVHLSILGGDVLTLDKDGCKRLALAIHTKIKTKKDNNISDGGSIDYIKQQNEESGINEILRDKKENWWIDCHDNPSDENIRLAKELYRYWEQHGILPNQVSVQEFKRCYARVNAHWSNGEVDEDGNNIYELLDKGSKI
jgi:hypothetical protein